MIYDNSFYEVQKYVNQTNHVYSTIFNLLSVDIWNGLSEDQQNIITLRPPTRCRIGPTSTTSLTRTSTSTS